MVSMLLTVPPEPAAGQARFWSQKRTKPIRQATRGAYLGATQAISTNSSGRGGMDRAITPVTACL